VDALRERGYAVASDRDLGIGSQLPETYSHTYFDSGEVRKTVLTFLLIVSEPEM
jgi:hypothetical protein